MDVSDLYRTEGDAATDGGSTIVLNVHVQPGAGRSAAVGRHGTSLKVRVAAAPEGGRANDACVALLADTFGLKPVAVELVSGPSSRSKQFRLRGLDLDEFRRQLERAAAGESPGGPGSPARTAGRR